MLGVAVVAMTNRLLTFRVETISSQRCRADIRHGTIYLRAGESETAPDGPGKGVHHREDVVAVDAHRHQHASRAHILELDVRPGAPRSNRKSRP